MAVQIVLDDLLPPPVDSPDLLARRIFALGIEQRREDLVRAGVPLAQWTSDSDLGGIVGGLDRLHRRVRMAS